MKNTHAKGANAERELAAALGKILGVHCFRGAELYVAGKVAPDVGGLLGFIHVECKRRERGNLSDAVAQSAADAGPEEVPVVCHRASRQEWIASIRLADLARLGDALNRLAVNERTLQPF